MENCKNSPCEFVKQCLLREYFVKKNRRTETLAEQANPAEAFDGYGPQCPKRALIEKGFRRILRQSRIAQSQMSKK